MSWDRSYHSIFYNSILESDCHFQLLNLGKFYNLSGPQFPHQCKGISKNPLMEHRGEELTHHTALVSVQFYRSAGMRDLSFSNLSLPVCMYRYM